MFRRVNNSEGFRTAVSKAALYQTDYRLNSERQNNGEDNRSFLAIKIQTLLIAHCYGTKASNIEVTVYVYQFIR